jgi:hypothetical protein
MNPIKAILPILLLPSSAKILWFASNAVMSDLVINFGLSSTAVGQLNGCRPFGFILGTLVFALLAITDRFSFKVSDMRIT